ncbi:hypothetical protein B0H12DRAFT_1272523 [Mycena haematopus]|nr:hypothetical protein B0H12DRAFT_1272523 [Mycena haematopus]
MSDTTLQARLGVNASPNRPWKKARKSLSLSNDYQQQHASWSRRDSSSSSYELEEGYEPPNYVTPSLIERLGPKTDLATQPRSLLERIDFQGTEGADTAEPGVAHTSEVDFMPLDPANINREVDGGIAVESLRPFSAKDGELPEALAKSPTQSKLSWNRSSPTSHRVRAADSDHINRRTSEALAVDNLQPAPNHNSSTTTPKVHETPAIDHPISTSDPSLSMHAPSNRNLPPLSLQARLGRALRSAVFQNAKLRDPTLDAEKVRSKIDNIVTDTVSEAFGAQMRKVRKEMDASRASNQTEEVIERAKDQPLNGLENARHDAQNTWSKQRDSQSVHASTSILPTPPPSEPLPAEMMDNSPPKAPKAMLMPPVLPERISLKGKEKAVESTEEDNSGATRIRRASYTRTSLYASPMRIVSSEDGSLRARSPPRRASPSPSRSSFLSHKRRGEEPHIYRYRSPPRPRTNFSPPDRRRSLTRSPARTNHSHSPVRSSRRPSLQRPPSHFVRRDSPARTRSFNTDRRPTSRSPPPAASYSNGFRSKLSRKSRSRSTARAVSRGRTFSGREFNSRHAYEKRPFARSPSPFRGRMDDNVRGRRSRSPNSRKRKLTPPRSRSPLRHAPSHHPDFRNSHNDSPTHDSSLSPPPPPNPCNDVPGLWFVKVGADSSKVLEGRFVVEPQLAATWGILPTPTTLTARPTPKLSVVLLCLPTETVSALYNSLIPTNPTAGIVANAVAALETAWPQDGTLFLDMNEQGGGKTWLPHEINPALPLDVTNHIRPGPNVVRFIQLASMTERTFIMYASPRKPPDMAVSAMFENAATTQITDPLFNFRPTTATVAAPS